MLLLSIDTSGKQGTIALVRASELPASSGIVHHNVEVIQVAALAGGAFSAQLVPQVAALLAKHDFRKTDIDGFIVASGPGSFTGLRVGLAAIKALAEVLAKPIAAVSLLEVLALAAGTQGRIIAALDAGRGEVYAGEYEVHEGSVRLVKEQLLTKPELLVQAKALSAVTSDKLLSEALASAAVQVVLVDVLNAGSIAALGWRKIRAGEVISPEQLDANYIRRTDAEILANR